MFLGHFGVGFGAKAVAPRVSLGALFLAAQFVDLVWPTLLALGIEQVRIVPGITRVTPLDFIHYPYTHSLAAVLVWAALFAAIYAWVARSNRGVFVVAFAVVSHWVLDLLVHRPDLQLYPGGASYGFGLWNSPGTTLALELGLFAAGVGLYLRTTVARDAVGNWALWSLIVFLLFIQAANMTGPPPPSVAAIAWAGHAQWLLVLWAYWVDRHRATRAVLT